MLASTDPARTGLFLEFSQPGSGGTTVGARVGFRYEDLSLQESESCCEEGVLGETGIMGWRGCLGKKGWGCPPLDSHQATPRRVEGFKC